LIPKTRRAFSSKRSRPRFPSFHAPVVKLPPPHKEDSEVRIPTETQPVKANPSHPLKVPGMVVITPTVGRVAAMQLRSLVERTTSKIVC